jgi:protein-tyrosine phosphatase
VIDLQAHILPGLDAGARDLETSIAMARLAVDDGISVMVATPAVGARRSVPPVAMLYSVGAVNLALVRQGIRLGVLPGALLDATLAGELDDGVLRTFSLGGSDCVLVESPVADGAGDLDDVLATLQARGFRPMLAHPERSPVFDHDLDRLARLVARGVTVSVDVGSMTGRFGEATQRLVGRLLQSSLVHVVCSDARDTDQRAPRLSHAFDALGVDLPALRDHMRYFTDDAPAAILAGRAPPAPPKLRRRSRFAKLIRGR